jgi:hypothetical protein
VSSPPRRRAPERAERGRGDTACGLSAGSGRPAASAPLPPRSLTPDSPSRLLVLDPRRRPRDRQRHGRAGPRAEPGDLRHDKGAEIRVGFETNSKGERGSCGRVQNLRRGQEVIASRQRRTMRECGAGPSEHWGWVCVWRYLRSDSSLPGLPRSLVGQVSRGGSRAHSQVPTAGHARQFAHSRCTYTGVVLGDHAELIVPQLMWIPDDRCLLLSSSTSW